MSFLQRRAAKGLAAGSFFVAASAGALAQDTTNELESLKLRVAELEKKQAASGSGGGDVKWNELSALGSKFQIYGYLRLDAIYDDSRPNNDQVIAFIRSEDPTAPAAFRAKNNSSDFNMHPKLTRFGLNFTGPTIADLGDAQVLGKLEIDFYNATATESREAIRMRLGYLQLKWASVNVYAGQMWDLISPLFPIVNPDFVMWGAGNLADRRPQVRAEWVTGESTKFTLAGMVGGTGADDAQDLDANGYRDGDQAAFPTLQARAGVKTPMGEKTNFEFGVWVHHAHEEVDGGTAAVGGERNFVSAAYGLDIQIPIWQDRVWTKGELWIGRNLDDVRGGILQGINTAGQEIGSQGGFGEVGFKVFPDSNRVSLYAGYSWDNPDNDDLIVSATNAPRSRNSIYYAAIRWDYKPVYFGFDYLHWVTGYKGFDQGDDNRFQAFVQYSF